MKPLQTKHCKRRYHKRLALIPRTIIALRAGDGRTGVKKKKEKEEKSSV